jgi:hypothetical protein
MDPIILSVVEKDSMSSEEVLIDRYLDVFDTEITISPISVSRANLFDNVGKQIPFIEVVHATIFPYTLEVAFPFPKFIGWCRNQYSQEDKVVLNKQGSKVLCRVEILSIHNTLSIPESLSIVSKPFEEEKIIMVYRECLSEVKDLVFQTIVKP